MPLHCLEETPRYPSWSASTNESGPESASSIITGGKFGGIRAVRQNVFSRFTGCSIKRHFYVNGMAGAEADEQRRFLQAHPTLYQDIDQTTHLRIIDGKINLRDLNGPGFATHTYPDFKQSAPVLQIN